MAKRGKAKKGLRGKLKKADFGYSLPVDQPLYHPVPVVYQESTMLMYTYETDPEAAAAVLPEQLTLTETPTARLIFATYKYSSIGFYNEVVQALECTYGDRKETFNYPVRLHVTSDRAMAAGREIGGFPKKIGKIEFNAGAEYLSYLDSPEGLRICSGVMIPDKLIAEIKGPPVPTNYISLRVMPSPDPTQKPSIRELMQTVWTLGPGEMWSGIGSVHLNGTSDLDPYHKLPVVKQTAAKFFRGDMTISTIKSLESF